MEDLLDDSTDPMKKSGKQSDEKSSVKKKDSSESEASLHLEGEEPDFSDGFKKAEKAGPPPPLATNATIPIATAASKSSSKSASKSSAEDATVRLNSTKAEPTESTAPVDATGSVSAASQQQIDDEVRASVGRFGAFRNTSSPTGAALAQSENLRIAQGRILELEQEVERLRVENEELAAAGETFRRKSDELSSRAEDLENRYDNAVASHAEEKVLLLENKENLRHELEALKAKNEDLELRISTNIQKIRVRERELENRLELVKMEGSALIRSKDELILDLKRQMDQLNLELNNYRTKSQEMNRMILDKQDILRRTVKALRLALTMLEGDEESAAPVKKAK